MPPVGPHHVVLVASWLTTFTKRNWLGPGKLRMNSQYVQNSAINNARIHRIVRQTLQMSLQSNVAPRWLLDALGRKQGFTRRCSAAASRFASAGSTATGSVHVASPAFLGRSAHRAGKMGSFAGHGPVQQADVIQQTPLLILRGGVCTCSAGWLRGHVRQAHQRSSLCSAWLSQGRQRSLIPRAHNGCRQAGHARRGGLHCIQSATTV